LREIRTLRSVEERRVKLAPTPLERDPGVARARGVRATRNRHDRGSHVDSRPARVVAAHAFFGRTAEVQRLAVEVRMRAVGWMDDWMRAADALELRVVPVCPLGALVLAVAALDR